jgi:hypothetical protein
MAAKLIAIADTAAFSPLKCIAQLASDMVEGKVKARRIVVVIENENADAEETICIRASGPGMDFVPTSIGLLMLAVTDLSITVL